MPTALRDLVEETVRRELPKLPAAAAAEFDERGEVIAVVYTPEQERVMEEMVRMGFRKGHVTNALAHLAAHPDGAPLRVGVLSHLHLHVPEEDLPLAFRSSKPADATARLATNKDSDALARAWKVERVAKEMGAPIAAVERAMEEADGVEGLAVELIGRRLAGWWSEAGGAADEAGLTDAALLADVATREPLSAEEQAEMLQRREDELELLEGVFGPRFRRIEGGAEIVVSVPPTTRRKGAPPPTGPLDLVILRVLFHEASLYPSLPSPTTSAPRLPAFHVVSPSLPSYLLLHLTSLILAPFGHPSSQARHAGLDLALGGEGGVVAELANMLEETYKAAIETPPDARTVVRPLLGPPEDELEVAAPISRGPKAATRGRTQNFRRGTPAQHKGLQEYAARNAQTPAYKKMLAVRQKLPAWDMQGTIVDLIRNNRVTIVSGETGSGKTTQGESG